MVREAEFHIDDADGGMIHLADFVGQVDGARGLGDGQFPVVGMAKVVACSRLYQDVSCNIDFRFALGQR